MKRLLLLFLAAMLMVGLQGCAFMAGATVGATTGIGGCVAIPMIGEGGPIEKDITIGAAIAAPHIGISTFLLATNPPVAALYIGANAVICGVGYEIVNFCMGGF